ncbi:uncharacterized protein LOC133187678 [Saccostrea echinata]|uniref:uncharacterized protein LOC133187678 n=1 Tax=Saccostrea echinata TaxID=191078 RepID=UPI002A7FBD18|nr:uncharacterized protein LOC133187678 [Saccostrea echinata]
MATFKLACTSAHAKKIAEKIALPKNRLSSTITVGKMKGMLILILVLTGTLFCLHLAMFESKIDYFHKPTIWNKFRADKRISLTMNPDSVLNFSPNFETKSTSYRENTRNLTVITAYWNLGTFQKGLTGAHFSTNTYFSWAFTFKYLLNQLVVYTDMKEFKELIENLRVDLINSTKIFLLNRTDVWPFQLKERMKVIYSQPGYPKYYPNTVNPGYTAAQHAKYAVVANTVRKGIFRAPYYAWLDVGYFRDIAKRKVFFELHTPEGFDPDRLAVNRINDLSMNVDPFNIFRNNDVWVGGGMFLGSGKVILEFEKLYHKAVLYFLEQKIMNSDQQVLYALYSKKGREALKPNLELQLYIPKGSGNPWFYLGYLCVNDVLKERKIERQIGEE